MNMKIELADCADLIHFVIPVAPESLAERCVSDQHASGCFQAGGCFPDQASGCFPGSLVTGCFPEQQTGCFPATVVTGCFVR